MQQPLPVRLGHPPHGNPGPLRHNSGNVLRVQRQPAEESPLLAHQLLQPVAERRRLLKAVLPYCLRQFLIELPAGFFHGLLPFSAAPGPGRRLVQQIHRLIRQKMIRQIPAAQIHRRLHGLGGNAQAVVLFQPRPEGFQHGQRFRPRRLPDDHRPETALQRGVFFDVLAVFLQGGGPDDLNLAAAQSRLQQIGRVNGALGGAGSHQRVHFIDK